MRLFSVVCERITPCLFPIVLAIRLGIPHRCFMRMLPLVTLVGAGCLVSRLWAGEVFGAWKTNPLRSANSYSPGLVVRFERHPKGEVFTVDRMEANGRTTTSSTILYLDGKEREFQGFGCSGIQWSRRLDAQTVEIFRSCTAGGSTRFIRRLSTQTEELVLEITEQKPDGRRFESRLVLEKQTGADITQPH